jgi:parvulin-like peptidyl-prolyl isomerase
MLSKMIMSGTIDVARSRRWCTAAVAMAATLACTASFAQTQAPAPVRQKPAAAQPMRTAPQPAARSAPQAALARATDNSDVVARVADHDVTVSEVRSLMAGLAERDQAALARDPALLSRTVKSMLASRLVLKEALAKKWEANPTIAAQLDRVREQAIIETYLRAVSAPPESYPDEGEIQKAYDANKSAFLVPRRFQLAQVFVALPANADKAAEAAANKKLSDVQLKLKTANFAAVAKEASDQRETAENGGEIGWLQENQLQPEIKTEVMGLAKGAVTGPIKLEDGWHFIKLIDTRPAETRSLADVHDALVQRLRAQRAQALQQAYVARLLEQDPPAVNELALSKVFSASEGQAPAAR